MLPVTKGGPPRAGGAKAATSTGSTMDLNSLDMSDMALEASKKTTVYANGRFRAGAGVVRCRQLAVARPSPLQ